jgi:hypothetical protein
MQKKDQEGPQRPENDRNNHAYWAPIIERCGMSHVISSQFEDIFMANEPYDTIEAKVFEFIRDYAVTHFYDLVQAARGNRPLSDYVKDPRLIPFWEDLDLRSPLDGSLTDDDSPKP